MSLACWLLLATSAPADWVLDLRTDVLYDDNLSHSNREADERDDGSNGAAIHAGRFDQLTDDLRLAVTADVAARTWWQYGDFNEVAAGGTASLRYRFGLGALAPFLRVEGSAAYAAVEDELQAGGRYRAGVTIGKRLTERLALDLSYGYEQREGRLRVFEQKGHTLSVRAAFDLTSTTQVSAGYQVRWGEVVSYAMPPRPDVVALANARLPVRTFGDPYVAYNLDARTHTFWCGLSQALTDWLAVSVRYEHQATARGHLHYRNNLFTAAIDASF